ncbi:MAG: hypothetical protein MZU97_11560 [Bacillus subtilis]|nr:hypothetical protein [Bacillus subtilis]
MINKRLQFLLEDIEKEKNLQSIETKINESVRKSADQSQKEYYLREKMRAIQEDASAIPGRTTSRSRRKRSTRATCRRKSRRRRRRN